MRRDYFAWFPTEFHFEICRFFIDFGKKHKDGIKIKQKQKQNNDFIQTIYGSIQSSPS